MTTKLKWRQSYEWYIESDKGGYRVTRYIQDGKPIYQALKGDKSLLVAGDSKLCRAACEKDQNGN